MMLFTVGGPRTALGPAWSLLRHMLFAVAALFVAGALATPASARTGFDRNRCAALAGSVPGGNIVTAQWVDQTSDGPAFCAVQMSLASEPGSNIRALLLLPAGWNGRLLGIGDHGLAGYIPKEDMQRPLARGFAVFGSDTGHNASLVDASWIAAGGPALKDFGWRATHVSTIAAKAVVKRAYGRAARFAYFQGCSTGGRMAMREAQQFPDDFNGVIVGSAPLDWVGILTEQLWAASLVQRNGTATPGWIAPDRYPWITAAALAACDGLDGLKDGLVSDPRRCERNVRRLQCQPGQANNCLTAAQVDAIDRTYAPLNDPTGSLIFEGLEPTGETGWVSPKGPHLGPGPHVRSYFAALFGGSSWDWRSFNFSSDVTRARELDRAGAQINSLETDLSPYRLRGGKIIQYHGWLDPAMSPGFYLRFYQAVAARTTAGDEQRLADFYRLFMVPGMEHCSGGAAPNSFGGFEQPAPPAIDPAHDVLAALVDWVENGRAPKRLIATQYQDNQRGGGIRRQMPLCPYPAAARWQGRGNPNDASSFVCALPARSSALR